jgi:hypothetical protein
MGNSTGGFLAVFEQRVAQQRKRLNDELDKEKPIRCRRTLKRIIKEIKEWEGVLKQHKKEGRRCPHCNGKLD